MSTYIRQTPADDNFKKWFIGKVSILKQRSEIILARGEEHIPMLFVFERNQREVGIMPVPFDSVRDKDLVAAIHQTVAQLPFVEGVILLVEAWSATLTDGEEQSFKPGTLKDRPGSQEILLFNGIRGTMQLMADFVVNDDRSLGRMTLRDPIAMGSVGRFIVGDTGRLDS